MSEVQFDAIVVQQQVTVVALDFDAAEYRRVRALAGTSGSGTWFIELTSGWLLARPQGSIFLVKILPP